MKKASLLNKLNTYLNQMFHFDPDNMQMGAKSVCQLIVSGQLQLQSDKQTSNRIREAFIKQMQLDNYNVHAHAIKCIAQMVPKLPSEQIQKIFQKIIHSIADKNLDEKKRQIYGICAGTVIHQAAEQYGHKLEDLFVESVKQLILDKDQKSQIQVILINVVAEFVRKWPIVSANCKNKFDVNNLVVYLLKNIQTKSKLQIVKKSQTALGKISLILNKDHFQVLFNNQQYGLLKFIKQNNTKISTQQMKNLRNGLLCLMSILKTQNSQIKHWAIEISHLIVQLIIKYKQINNIDLIDFTCDILDCCVVSLYYLVKTYSRQLELLSNNNNKMSEILLNSFIEQLINFNQQAIMQYLVYEDQQKMEIQKQEENQYDDYYQDDQANQQKGWKVRRAIVNYVAILVQKNHVFRQKFINSQHIIKQLTSKLIQTNSMVSQMAFQSFNNIIECLSISNKSSDTFDNTTNIIKQKQYSLQFIHLILTELTQKTRIIFKSTKVNDQLKIQSLRTINKFIELFKDDLNNNESRKIVDGLVDCLIEEMRRTDNLECKNYCLLALKELIYKDSQFQKYSQVIKLAIKWLNVQNLKLSSSAYRFLRRIMYVFHQELYKSEYFSLILDIIKKKLKQHDADRLIKQNIIKFLGYIFEFYIQRISVQDEKDIISSLNTKLKIQIQKGYLLDQFERLPQNYTVRKQNINLYKQTVEIVSNNLGITNTQLSYKTINVIQKIINILGDNLDTKTVSNVLAKSKSILNEYKVPSFIQIIIKKYPSQIKPFSEYIIKSTQLKYIILLIQYKIISHNQCIKILKTVDNLQQMKNINLILAKIGVNENDLKSQIDQSKWGLICLGTLGYVGNGLSVQYLIDMMVSQKSQQFKLQAASALGNIAARCEGDVIDRVLQMAEKCKNYYVFIYTVKEYLNFKLSNNQTSKLISNNLIGWLFQKSQITFQGQSIYHLISECIGKIALLSNHSLQQIINLSSSQVQNHRFVIANSIKFYFQGKIATMQDQLIFDYTKKSVQLIKDKSVNVRTAITKSLNSIASKHYQVIQRFMNVQFWNDFKKNLEFDDTLIIQVDYGISKEKKDLGKSLRLESFNFLKFVLKNANLDSSLISDLINVSLIHLSKQNNPDLVIKRLQTVRKLCYLDFTQFINHLTLFIQKISIQEGILKSYLKKSGNQDQRTEIYLKGILKQILLINKVAQKENIENIKGYITSIKANQRFASIFKLQQLINVKND